MILLVFFQTAQHTKVPGRDDGTTVTALSRETEMISKSQEVRWKASENFGKAIEKPSKTRRNAGTLTRTMVRPLCMPWL